MANALELVMDIVVHHIFWSGSLNYFWKNLFLFTKVLNLLDEIVQFIFVFFGYTYWGCDVFYLLLASFVSKVSFLFDI